MVVLRLADQDPDHAIGRARRSRLVLVRSWRKIADLDPTEHVPETREETDDDDDEEGTDPNQEKELDRKEEEENDVESERGIQTQTGTHGERTNSYGDVSPNHGKGIDGLNATRIDGRGEKTERSLGHDQKTLHGESRSQNARRGDLRYRSRSRCRVSH
ncbi:hypothetical protein DL546_008810 [Coniochaeta pulveracea]|uniref:Uncharacterized protein n=1 Tax=Coniochaeta pulveracea TaxID=177199 RepID=A0A420YH91_9PEZI|nr:hypothetical protein DL546_008810 [Coniochaeta pulveracea]